MMNWSNYMKKKGFTLVEVIMGLFLLGLISITILPIINTSFMRLKNHSIRVKMVYIGESIIENIKAYDIESNSDLFICGTSLEEIIQGLRDEDDFSMDLNYYECNNEFTAKLTKTNTSGELWLLTVLVSCNTERNNIKDVKYMAYLQKK